VSIEQEYILRLRSEQSKFQPCP